MITRQTAFEICMAYDEIAKGEKLLQIMAELTEHGDAPLIEDAFGRRHNMQLGVPTGENRHRLLDVAPELAKQVISAHVANKRAELAVLNERARAELEPKV